MQLDYITIKLVFDEIYPLIMESQIREVVARGKRAVVLALRYNHELSLLISAEPDNSRIHLLSKTPRRSENPDEHFHRIMRHHISGSIVEDFSLLDGERIVEIRTARKDFSGKIKRYRFIAELMGRYSNLVLVDEDDIIQISDRTQVTKDGKGREIRAGKQYVKPSLEGKIPLKQYSLDDFSSFIENADKDLQIGKLLLSSFAGMTPGVAGFITERSDLKSKEPVKNLTSSQIELVHESFIKAIEKINKKELFPPFDEILDVDRSSDFPLNRALAEYYEIEIAGKTSQNREHRWRKTIESRIKSLDRLVKNLSKDLSKAEKSAKYRKFGDLIYANINEFKPGVREIEVDDITDPESNEKVKIKLITGKDAVASAQEYHKRASRLSRGEKEISKRLQDAKKQLDEYRELLEIPEEILNSDDDQFDKAVQDIKGGKTGRYVGRKTSEAISTELPRKLHGENIHHYRSHEGHDIYVGGNEKANEALYKWGHPDDYWLHVKNIPGSHVLIPRRGEAIEFDTILFAAQIAVYHSKVKGATKVPVDYTLMKYVKKPPGAEPGYVIYSKEKNVLVDSIDERTLKKNKVK